MKTLSEELKLIALENYEFENRQKRKLIGPLRKLSLSTF